MSETQDPISHPSSLICNRFFKSALREPPQRCTCTVGAAAWRPHAPRPPPVQCWHIWPLWRQPTFRRTTRYKLSLSTSETVPADCRKVRDSGQHATSAGRRPAWRVRHYRDNYRSAFPRSIQAYVYYDKVPYSGRPAARLQEDDDYVPVADPEAEGGSNKRKGTAPWHRECCLPACARPQT